MSRALPAGLYTTMACPYAHRAMLAFELRPVRVMHDRTTITTTNQFVVADRIGLGRGDELGMLGMHAGKTVAEMQERKETFKRDINPRRSAVIAAPVRPRGAGERDRVRVPGRRLGR
jgi:hypothetical protein